MRTAKMWHPTFSESEAKEKVSRIMNGFKGKRMRGDRYFTGGSASATFNKMYDLIAAEDPVVPILGTKFPPAMTPALSGDFGKPNQLNFCVQAAGSSYGLLACLIVGISHLFREYELDFWYGGSVHDEVMFIVAEEQAELATYLMQMAHAWSWALTHAQLGVFDLPATCAFVSGISIDKIWRKDAKKNPSTITFDYKAGSGRELGISDSVAALAN